MDFNRFIFPAPNASYTPFTLEKMIWVPRTRFFSMKGLVKLEDSYANYYSNAKDSSRSSDITKQSKCTHSALLFSQSICFPSFYSPSFFPPQ